ncbi:MAG: YggT family protein [Chloroflexi bacterium]|nr:YggT family protein [Chloroflexota bacterium]
MALSNRETDRREDVHTVERTGVESTTQVVQDVGAERNLAVYRLTSFLWLLNGILEVLFGLRFVLKLFAANAQSVFAAFVYNFTEVFLWPFRGLVVTPTAANGMVLEISTLVAMVAYFILFWIITALVSLLFGPSRVRSVRTVDRERDLR